MRPWWALAFVGGRTRVAYLADRKSFSFRNGVWLSSDYGTTARSRPFLHDYEPGSTAQRRPRDGESLWQSTSW